MIDPAGTARAAALGEEHAALPSALVEAAADADLDEAELALGIELGRMVQGPHGRSLHLLVAAARLAHARGSTRLPLGGPGLSAQLRDLGIEESTVAELCDSLKRSTEAFAPIVGGIGSYRPLIVDGDYLYHHRMLELEMRVAKAMAERLHSDQEMAGLEEALSEIRASPPRAGAKLLSLSEEQELAVATACRGRLTLISGEPGTGKTSIVVSILRVLCRLQVPLESIALAAPTGKAADRMRSSIAASLAQIHERGLFDQRLYETPPSSQTLHRLLGYSPATGRFHRNEHDPLAEDVVIVDESSMIDLMMVDRLLRALRPEAKLILLGDADQLPSVDAGAVFRDLCASLQDRGAVRRLTKSYRMDPSDPAGRAVLSAARLIHRSKSSELLRTVPRRSQVSELEWTGVEQLGPEHRRELLRRWESEIAVVSHHARRTFELHREVSAADRQRLEEIFGSIERARILCLTRGRPTGVESTNDFFHRRLLQAASLPPSVLFAVGEPILVTRNDYERRLFNGDQGVVLFARLHPDQPSRPAAVFRRDDGFFAVPLDAIRNRVELAHAVTIHKAQGSEHNTVAILLPDTPIPLLTREMLYTALTRARKSVVLVGTPELIAHGINAKVERSSGLAQRTQAAF